MISVDACVQRFSAPLYSISLLLFLKYSYLIHHEKLDWSRILVSTSRFNRSVISLVVHLSFKSKPNCDPTMNKLYYNDLFLLLIILRSQYTRSTKYAAMEFGLNNSEKNPILIPKSASTQGSWVARKVTPSIRYECFAASISSINYSLQTRWRKKQKRVMNSITYRQSLARFCSTRALPLHENLRGQKDDLKPCLIWTLPTKIVFNRYDWLENRDVSVTIWSTT